jgi:hypothetical protein
MPPPILKGFPENEPKSTACAFTFEFVMKIQKAIISKKGFNRISIHFLFHFIAQEKPEPARSKNGVKEIIRVILSGFTGK